MKRKMLSFNRLMWSMLFVGSMLFNVSCNDKFKEEIDALKASNAELQSQLDLDGSTITELEAQKAALEVQKTDADADIASLNEMIAKLESMIASRYVERYLSTIIGTENHETYQWQHLYNEDMQLAVSKYTQVGEYNYHYYDIISGGTSSSVVTEITHNYQDGVLISSTWNELTLYWSYTNGKITEIAGENSLKLEESVVYTISETSGNIIRRTITNQNGQVSEFVYSYNEHNLVTKIEYTGVNGNLEVEQFTYDAQLNLIAYLHTNNADVRESTTWTIDEVGRIVKYINNSYGRIDSVSINYNIDGSWEVYAQRKYDWDDLNQYLEVSENHYDANENPTYSYFQYGSNSPSINEQEYDNNGLLTLIRNYYFIQDINGNWYESQKNTYRYLRDETGVVRTEERETTNYDESGAETGGSLTSYLNITWSSNGNHKLNYSVQEYDFAAGELTYRRDYEHIETDEGNIFSKNEYLYMVSNGQAEYVSYSYEISEYFTESPYAPKVSVSSTFNESGLISSDTNINSVNSAYDDNWSWTLVQ